MSRILKFAVFSILGLALFVFVWSKVGFLELKSGLNVFFSLAGVLTVLCVLLFIIFGILKWQSILNNLGQRFKFKKLGDIWLIGSAISYFTPFALFGGELFEIYFLQKRFKKLPKPITMASVAIDKLLDGTVFFVFLICGCLSLAFFGYLPNSLFTAGLFLSAGFFFLILFVFYLRKAQGKTILDRFLAKTGNGNGHGETGQNIILAEERVFQFFSLKNKGLWLGFFFSFLRYGFVFLRAFILIFFLTGETNLLKVLAVFGFSSLAALTPSPASLGSLELTLGLAFSALGLGFAEGAAFSLVWRIGDTLIYVFGLFLFVKLSGWALKEKILGFFHS